MQERKSLLLVMEIKVNVHWRASRIFKITSTVLIIRTYGAWHRVVWYSSTNFSDDRAAWKIRDPITDSVEVKFVGYCRIYSHYRQVCWLTNRTAY